MHGYNADTWRHINVRSVLYSENNVLNYTT